jgi:integrase
MEIVQTTTFTGAVNQWLAVNNVGRKPRTQEFNREIADTILTNWHEPFIEPEKISMDDVLFFAERVTRFCPSRWNAIVAALRFVTPHGRILKRRAARSRNFIPPNQLQFQNFLAECDAARKGCHVGLVVRFLTWTGMRIEEARLLKWKNVSDDTLFVPAEITKSGKPREIPILSGLQETLARLRSVSDGDFVLPRQSARKAIESACVRAGIPKMSFHCFRHLFATRCVESRVDVATIALWLGHQDKGELLLKTYNHSSGAHSREMAKLVKISA